MSIRIIPLRVKNFDQLNGYLPYEDLTFVDVNGILGYAYKTRDDKIHMSKMTIVFENGKSNS